MDHMIENILANPLYIVIAIVIVAVLVFAILKKLMKLIIVALVLLVACAGYLYFTGDRPRDAVKTVIQEGKDAVKK